MRLALLVAALFTMALPLRPQLRIVTLDPGHFHAALLQKEQLPDFVPEAWVYAPLGPDLTAHLNRVAGFNLRAERPTAWKLRVYAGADYWERLLAEKPGDVVVISGRNRGKIERVEALIRQGRHLLVDKPWIIEPEELPRLEAALEAADANRVIGYDAMTQRYEISCILQRALVSDPEVFGRPLAGTEDHPAVYMESVHFLLKLVAGVPNLRPPWFFDVRQQGEGLTDVGTHLVDLVHWILFPDQAIDYRRDIRMLAGLHWPTLITRSDFDRVTGAKDFPDYLRGEVGPDGLRYFCNNRVDYLLRGSHVRLDVKWGFEAPAGSGDTELAIFRGTRSRVEVRQGPKEKFRPEVFVVPAAAGDLAPLAASVRKRLARLSAEWPDLKAEERGGEIQILIPDRFRIGHEAHFALLADRFLHYVHNPRALPAWEKPNMLAKYYITTQGVALARQAPVASPPSAGALP